MPWVEVFAVFIVSHLVGDFLIQTDWQARHKRGREDGDPLARRALAAHVLTYTLCFVPALIWLASGIGAWAIGVGVLIALPHMVQDDGQLLGAYMRRVKGFEPEPGPLAMAVDQSAHVLVLFLTALLVAS